MSTGVLKKKIQNVFNVKAMNFQLVCSEILLYYFRTDVFTLADPGFPRLVGAAGGVNPKGGGICLSFGQIFPEHCIKMKEIGRLWRPLDQPMIWHANYIDVYEEFLFMALATVWENLPLQWILNYVTLTSENLSDFEKIRKFWLKSFVVVVNENILS